MTLRQWQTECISQAYQQYCIGNAHFLTLATPGAGKTRMASALAKLLLDKNLIDLVVCFAPSVIVAEDFQDELEVQTSESFNGLLGSRGRTLTYQGMLTLNESFWDLFRSHRVFAIFDEIHHCAGVNLETANAWGERIISKIQGKATYTLALTGTPWRSDAVPIVLSRYCQDSGQIHCNYQYGLARAIADNVCRTPRLTIIDNDNIVVQRGDEHQSYTAFRDLLMDTECSYYQLLETEALIIYVLQQANRRLTELRINEPDAGGLVVAASVAHAQLITEILGRELGESAAIATYREDEPLSTIRRYKDSREKWIVSVGMISEGTNVPRLRVCCHLTRVKTELYFRQILGRILRANGQNGKEGYLFMPAEPTLVEFAQRLSEDIPNSELVKLETMQHSHTAHAESPRVEKAMPTTPIINIDLTPSSSLLTTPPDQPITLRSDSLLQKSYETTLNVLGRFRRELLVINGLEQD